MSAITLPIPRTPDPMEAPAVRWGVLAPGGIARSFASALRGTQGQVAAVGSRDLRRAQDFAHEFGATAAYGSYEELVADPTVDVVYIASPHSGHHEHALLALSAGKPVLVEKAFARSASEASEMLDLARGKGLFAAEAMWSRYLPHYDVVRQVVESGLIGEVTTVMADHGQALYPDGPQRLSDPELAGGALLDLGVYPVSFAAMVLGDFASLTAVGSLTPEGVDAQEGILAITAAGAMAVLSASMLGQTPTTGSVTGSSGRLELEGAFYGPGRLTLHDSSGAELDAFSAAPGDMHGGLRYEAAEVARCLHAGLTETPLMTHAHTLQVMRVMDEVRAQLGVRYPGETVTAGAATG